MSHNQGDAGIAAKTTTYSRPVLGQWNRRDVGKSTVGSTHFAGPDLHPLLKPPKPNQAFGFTPQTFPFPYASMHVKSATCPAREFTLPHLSVELKGRQGQLNVAKLQNSLNGAVMMKNVPELKANARERGWIVGANQRCDCCEYAALRLPTAA